MSRRRHRSNPRSHELTEVTANAYLAYLDKEMTIMGILSTFCVAVIALMVDRVGSAEIAADGVLLRLLFAPIVALPVSQFQAKIELWSPKRSPARIAASRRCRSGRRTLRCAAAT